MIKLILIRGHFGYNYYELGLCPRNWDVFRRGKASRRAEIRASNRLYRLSGKRRKGRK